LTYDPATQDVGGIVDDVENPNCTAAVAGFTWALIPGAPTPCVYVPLGGTSHVMLVTAPADAVVAAVQMLDGDPMP
jgi:hypothetical protein